jgi:hypothetical protein
VAAMTSRRFGVDIASFVDDLLNTLAVAMHAACKGLKGNCRICLETFGRAIVKMEQLDHILKACCLAFSDQGDLTIRRDHIFIGIVFDVLNGRLLITVEKFGKTMTLLFDVMQQAKLSSRAMAKLRGKFVHQFLCIEGVVPVAAKVAAAAGRSSNVAARAVNNTVPLAERAPRAWRTAGDS